MNTIHMKFNRITIMMLCSLLMFFASSCKDDVVVDGDFKTEAKSLTHIETDKTMYKTGENVSCSFTIDNPTSNAILEIREVRLTVKDLTDKTDQLRVLGASRTVAENVVIEPGNAASVDAPAFFTIAANIPVKTACGVFVEYIFEDGTITSEFGTFFRIIDDNTLFTYKIDTDNYQGLPIYKLTGGMSAEYGVEKALTSLGTGISHTWFTENNNGPYPVWASPDFLQLSLKKTVDMYNAVLGGDKVKLKTVVLGTGVPSVPYIATAMHAAYLPVHFLASINSVAEVEAIMDYSNRHVCASYATLGYDGSMPDPAVAWIKLLDLPEEYRKFIEDHQVEEVILWGVEENVLGETWAKKVIRDNPSGEFGAGSVYMQYTGHGSEADVQNLKKRINDYDLTAMEAETHIPDWESGLANKQISGITAGIKNNTSADVYGVTAFGDMIHIYDVASHLSLAYLKKNGSVLDKVTVDAVILNEYLTSNPQFEITVGRIPLLYWQFVPTQSTVDRIFNGYLANTITSYYPDITPDVLKTREFYLNSNYGKNELKSILQNYGVTGNISMRETSHDVWTGNGNSFCEVYAWVITNIIGVEAYQQKHRQSHALTVGELETICGNVGNSAQGLHFLKY